MGGEARLSDQQKRRAARIAREKSLTCPECGSSEPVPKDEAPAWHPDGGAEVAMGCEECRSAAEMTLVLSPEEAEALGLHALRDRPETPRQYLGRAAARGPGRQVAFAVRPGREETMRGAGRIGEHHPGREGGRIAVGREIGRGRFLKLAGGGTWAASLGLLTACATDARRGAGGEMPAGRQEIGSGAARGRLLASPAPPPPQPSASGGLRRLGLGSGRDGLLYVPRGHDATGATPLVLTLHGAGGDARSGISHLFGLADEFGLILLAPESRGRTWDVLIGGYGPDVGFIDRALRQTFDRLAVDAGRLALTGFSDGASYALSLGLTNGDLFTHAVAFSPGFAAPADRRGRPPVFVSHGKRDRVLPIERCSRRIVPQLEREGYGVRYREFDGPHTVPETVAREALEWFTGT